MNELQYVGSFDGYAYSHLSRRLCKMIASSSTTVHENMR